jgi:hypothetical protein
MNHLHRYCRSFLLSFGLVAFLVGCAVHARVYDPYYHDYHHWDGTEVGFYGRWETETHREHRDFNQRNDSEKKEYWDWRHQSDHDHDHR